MHSNYKSDLSKEQILGKLLDPLYSKYFKDKSYFICRECDIDEQHRGVDLRLRNQKNTYFVDEKAQLDYINNSLPTFAFEISYLKNESWHLGWLLDKNKISDIYFLITSIHVAKGKDLNTGLSKVKVTGVYRKQLLALLEQKGLTESRIKQLEKEIRVTGIDGKHKILELNPRSEGNFYYSKDNKNEQPINLVLKLKFLTKNPAVAKVLINF